MLLSGLPNIWGLLRKKALAGNTIYYYRARYLKEELAEINGVFFILTFIASNLYSYHLAIISLVNPVKWELNETIVSPNTKFSWYIIQF